MRAKCPIPLSGCATTLSSSFRWVLTGNRMPPDAVEAMGSRQNRSLYGCCRSERHQRRTVTRNRRDDEPYDELWNADTGDSHDRSLRSDRQDVAMTTQNIHRLHFDHAFRAFGALCLTIALSLTSQAKAQTNANDNAPGEEKPTALTHPRNPMVWDVDTMMDQAVQQISKRYSLNPQQELYTKLLLKRRVREFLDEHESEVRELLQESMDMQTGRAKADPVSRQIWAQRALPLYAQASQAILEGNEEWGGILTEEQKKIHDGDMNLMRRGFDGATTTLTQWSEGGGPPIPKINDPTVRNNVNGSDVKNGKGVTPDPKSVTQQNIEDNWRSYVNLFVTAYDLDKASQNSAREKILKEQYDKAVRYRQLRAADFQKIEKRLKTLGKSDYSEREKLKNRQAQLERPIYDLFIELDERLQRLPTAAQTAKVDAEEKKTLEQLHAALSGERAKKARDAAQRKTSKPAPPTDKAGDDAKPDEKSTPAKTPESSDVKKSDNDKKPEAPKAEKPEETKSPDTPKTDKMPAEEKQDEPKKPTEPDDRASA